MAKFDDLEQFTIFRFDVASHKIVDDAKAKLDIVLDEFLNRVRFGISSGLPSYLLSFPGYQNRQDLKIKSPEEFTIMGNKFS